MAYAMLERPKLLNARSLKFYPQDYEHHHPHQSQAFRHKTLSPDFDLSPDPLKNKGDDRSLSVKTRLSSEKKCPIYIHPIAKIGQHHREEGDFLLTSTTTAVPRKNKKKSNKLPKIIAGGHHKVMDKLEESYWANWKPEKSTQIHHNDHPPQIIKKKEKIIKVIKDPPKRQKIKIHPRPSSSFEIEIEKKSQEIQTENHQPQSSPPMILEETKPDTSEEILGEDNKLPVSESKLLRHTDSFVLTMKKQQGLEEKEHVEQPKCIRLYKKSSSRTTAPSTTSSFIKGGSYPLKSCLKPHRSSFHKANVRLGRPGSPLIVSSLHGSDKNSHKHKKF